MQVGREEFNPKQVGLSRERPFHDHRIQGTRGGDSDEKKTGNAG